jgi:myo-inositol-1-phosphate synthase
MEITDEAVKQAQWLWDVAYKHAVHSIGINDYSKMTFDDKKTLAITQAVLFKAMNNNLNSIRLANAIKDSKNTVGVHTEED